VTTRVHPPTLQYVGDDWLLPGTLFAADGQPLSLLDETLQWSLADKGSLNEAIGPGNVVIEIIDAANGAIRVRVPSQFTERLSPGRYYDALRTTDTLGNTRHLWTGVVHVERSGFYAPLQAGQSLNAARFVIAGGLLADATVV
jgi:hypothetical protein